MGDPEKPELPTSLRVIAYGSMFLGVCSIIHVVTSLFRGSVDLNLGVLQIPAGFGMLRLDRGWRTFKLACLWIYFAVFTIGAVALAFSGFRFTLLRKPPAESLKDLMILMAVPLLAYMIWEYRVLTSDPIRRLFGVAAR